MTASRSIGRDRSGANPLRVPRASLGTGTAVRRSAGRSSIARVRSCARPTACEGTPRPGYWWRSPLKQCLRGTWVGLRRRAVDHNVGAFWLRRSDGFRRKTVVVARAVVPQIHALASAQGSHCRTDGRAGSGPKPDRLRVYGHVRPTPEPSLRRQVFPNRSQISPERLKG